jgi:hypothetical protein
LAGFFFALAVELLAFFAGAFLTAGFAAGEGVDAFVGAGAGWYPAGSGNESPAARLACSWRHHTTMAITATINSSNGSRERRSLAMVEA